ncbi:hypothetical protein [Microvirga aerophila]|uniref:hypothetical protein n=1 Tax=Microvirga aerophila TaxID=670291 RepID=UPI0011BEEA35|nr:hypothetical protein [Microvirga aerophila]
MIMRAVLLTPLLALSKLTNIDAVGHILIIEADTIDDMGRGGTTSGSDEALFQAERLSNLSKGCSHVVAGRSADDLMGTHMNISLLDFLYLSGGTQ